MGGRGSETTFTHGVGGVHRLLRGIEEIAFLVGCQLIVQDVLLHHLEVPVFPWNVSVLQGDEDRVGVLALKPLFRFERSFRSGSVRVQVVLEKVRLQGRGGGEIPGKLLKGICSAKRHKTITRDHRNTHLARDSHDDGLTLPLVKLEESVERGKPKGIFH